MKRRYLSLLILLVVCITIGGAYATWAYAANQNVDEVTNSINVGLAETSIKTATGTISLDVNTKDAITATIDDTNDDKKADLVLALVNGFEGEGYRVTYTPDTSVENNSDKILMQATVTVTAEKYQEKNVIVANSNILKTDAEVSEWTITPAMIASCLNIGDLELPTPDSYAAFKQWLEENPISIEITISSLVATNMLQP